MKSLKDERLRIKCPSPNCNKMINFKIDTPEECPECGALLFPAIMEFAKKASKEIKKIKDEAENILQDKKINAEVHVELDWYPICKITVEGEKAIEKMRKIVKEYNSRVGRRKEMKDEIDPLYRNDLIVFPRIANINGRKKITQLEMYRFLVFITNQKHTI